jgi:pimeloyl-ACP methyl ester carboxylesterase
MPPIKIVLLPGLDGTGVLFRPLLNELPPDIQPIVFSYPTDQELGYEELLPLVLKALPQGAPYVLLGESFGGPLSLRVAATRPAGLKAVILCASFISCPHPFVPAWAAPLVRPLPFRAFPQFSQLKALLGRYSGKERQSLIKEALSLVQPRVLASRTREVIQVNVAAELSQIDCPILYIQGQHDLVVPIGNLRRILQIKPEVHSVQLPAPHMVLQTQPKLAADAISSFIAKLAA